MASVNEMREFFEQYFDEHGFEPSLNDYRIVHQKVVHDGELHTHTHLVVVPKKKGEQS